MANVQKFAIWALLPGTYAMLLLPLIHAPPLIAMGAEVTLEASREKDDLPLDQFFEGPGLTAMSTARS